MSKYNRNLLQPGFLAKYFLTSTCKVASSPLWIEPKFQELTKFDAGKQSSATLSQHMRFMSKRNAWRVARTTRGEPAFDSLADMTLIVPEWMMKQTIQKTPFSGDSHDGLSAKNKIQHILSTPDTGSNLQSTCTFRSWIRVSSNQSPQWVMKQTLPVEEIPYM